MLAPFFQQFLLVVVVEYHTGIARNQCQLVGGHAVSSHLLLNDSIGLLEDTLSLFITSQVGIADSHVAQQIGTRPITHRSPGRIFHVSLQQLCAQLDAILIFTFQQQQSGESAHVANKYLGGRFVVLVVLIHGSSEVHLCHAVFLLLVVDIASQTIGLDAVQVAQFLQTVNNDEQLF